MQSWIRIGFGSLLILTSVLTAAQNSFISIEEVILKDATEQWMCRELRTANPAHFDCIKGRHTWILPQNDSLPLFAGNMFLNESERASFNELIFPAGDCKRFLTLASLCDLYFPLFRKKTEASGLPKDFIYLPLVLSGCNTACVLDNGREGMWAMDYLVARKFHLRIDTLVDERRGADFTTDAALKYLVELSILYDNDELKMTSAFRNGVPFVHRIEDSNNETIFFNALDESSQQFFKLMAYLKALIESCRIDNQLNSYFDIFAQYENIFFTQDIRLDAMEAVLGVKRQELRELNPVYIGNYFEGDYRKIPYTLSLPQASAYTLLKDSIARWKPIVIPQVIAVEESQESVVYHKVKRGESLGKIASKHKTSVRKIKQWNHLKSDNIHVGQTLEIHKKKKTESKNPDAEKKEVAAPKVKKDVLPEPTKKESVKKESPKKGSETYTVKSGDSLWKIAKKYKGVTPEEIMKWNKCGEDLQPGQKLIIHLK